MICVKSNILFCEKEIWNTTQSWVLQTFEQNKITFNTYVVHYYFYKHYFWNVVPYGTLWDEMGARRKKVYTNNTTFNYF